MSVSDAIRRHLVEYPVGHRFTTDSVRRELNLESIQGKYYLFVAMVNGGFIKHVRMDNKNGSRQWIYQKVKEFTMSDIKPKRKSMDDPMIPHKEFDQFIFGGNAERIVDNLHFKTNGRV